MLAAGYEVIPVNPGQQQILGRRCYPDLDAIPVQVDLVDIFRAPSEVLPIVEAAVRIGAKVVWMQLGVVNREAAAVAAAAGLVVIMDRCLKSDHLDFGTASG